MDTIDRAGPRPAEEFDELGDAQEATQEPTSRDSAQQPDSVPSSAPASNGHHNSAAPVPSEVPTAGEPAPEQSPPGPPSSERALNDVSAASEAFGDLLVPDVPTEQNGDNGHNGHNGTGRTSGRERRSGSRATPRLSDDGASAASPAAPVQNGHVSSDGAVRLSPNGHALNGHVHDAASDAATADRLPAISDWRAPIVSSRSRVATLQARRRRRRFTHYVLRASRARQAARARAVTRATWAATIVVCLLIVATVASSVSAATSYYQSQSAILGSLNRKIAAQDSVRIYDDRGTLLYQFNDEGAQHSIPLSHVPVSVVNATIATEDKDFWVNQGVDFQAIARAAYTDLAAGHLQEGASTITQQLIKQNVLNSDPTFTRKLQEAILALGLTTQGTFTKRQVLEMYLNSIPYGPTSYGIDAAATAYFGYTDNPATGEAAAQHLDLAQASLLAGIPQSPSYYNPLSGPAGLQHTLARQQTVLNNMVAQGYITPAQAAAATKEAAQPGFFRPQLDQPNLAPHFVNYVRDQLDQLVSTGQLHGLSRSGLNVYTTLDLDLQNHVQQYMLAHLCGNDLNDYPGSPYRYIRDDNVTNTAGVLVDHHTGAIKVLLGSIDYYGNQTCHKIDGQFDVATQGFRGPGSSFKPLAYATAFEMGWFPAFTIANEPTVFWDSGAGKVYKPSNADNNHLSPNMTLRDALQLSQNIPAVKVMQYAGVENVQANAERMGIRTWAQGSAWGLSSVLGTLDVHLIDMVQAYTVFANYGQYIPLHAIESITDSAGDTVFQYHVPQPVQVLSPQIAFMITSILSDNHARAPEFGTCSVLYLDPNPGDCYYFNGNSPNAWPAAAKTGTGQDLTNDWAMGYTMDYTMGVWVGNNDYSSMNWVDGVTGAAPIWQHSLLYAERNLPKRPFPVPSGVHQATYTSNGVTTTDWFLDGPPPPPNIGNTGASQCVTYHNNTWDYCSGPPSGGTTGGGGGHGG